MVEKISDPNKYTENMEVKEKRVGWRVAVENQLTDGSKSLLPHRILQLRENSFTLFVSNNPEEMSKTELEAMFSRAGKIWDSFIPIDKMIGKK